jgi:hypothetical protein
MRGPAANAIHVEELDVESTLREFETDGASDDPGADNCNCHFSMIVRAPADPRRADARETGTLNLQLSR